MQGLVVFLALLVSASAQDVTCRCQAPGDRSNPTYPSIKECKIPNSDDYMSSFIEDDSTWNPDNEFPVDSWTTDPVTCPSPTTACQQTVMTKDGKWKCTFITPKCWEDVPQIEGSANFPYNCAALDAPKLTGQTCTIGCKTGYTMTGGPPQCQNGDWGNLIQCKNAGCGAPPTGCGKDDKGNNIVGCSYSCTNCPGNVCADGAVCVLTCPAGFKANENADCDKGVWDPAACVAVAPAQCTGPVAPAPANGIYNCGTTPNGQTCALKCPYGYTPAGTLPTCNNGQWTIATGTNAARCQCLPFEKIQANTPMACIFGGTDGIERLDFVVDVSGSMATTFQVGTVTWTRMNYVKQALQDAINSLDPTQQFNIISFSDNAAAWQNGVVLATAANKVAGVTFAKNLVANGGTNMLAGFQKAFSDPKVQGVFMLTDGVPTNGYGPIHPVVKAWSAAAVAPGGKVYPIGFQLTAAAEVDLKSIATYTNGKFHKVV